MDLNDICLLRCKTEQKRKEGHLKIANDGGKIATVNEHTNWIVSRGEVRGDLGMHMPLASQNP